MNHKNNWFSDIPTVRDLREVVKNDEILRNLILDSKALTERNSDVQFRTTFQKFWRQEIGGALFRARLEELGYNPARKLIVSKVMDVLATWDQ